MSGAAFALAAILAWPLPGAGSPLPPPPCDAAVEAAVHRGAAGDRDGALALLEEALPRCPGHPGLLRELAALHFAAGRRDRAEAVARRLVEAAPGDPYGWELLGTLRYLGDDPGGALRAWNRVDRPRVVAVEAVPAGVPPLPLDPRVLGLAEGTLLTPGGLERGARRLEALPGVARARLDYRPVEGGGARVEGAVTRHPPHTFRRSDLPAHALRALGGRVELSATDRAGWGERVVGRGRVDRGLREGVLQVAHPLPARGWGGESGVAVASWQAGHRVLRPGVGAGAGESLARSHLHLGVEAPPGRMGPWGTRIGGWVGVDRWDAPPVEGRAPPESPPEPAHQTRPGAGLRAGLEGPAGLTLGAELSRWVGGAGARALHLAVAPPAGPGGLELRGRGSLLALSGGSPADLAPRFGSGPGADHLARGAPGGSLTLLPPGRHWLHATLELSRSWTTRRGVTLGPALFLDGVRGVGDASGPEPGEETLGHATPTAPEAGDPSPIRPRSALHPGVGLRVGVPGVEGRLRLDLALDPRSQRLRLSVGW